MSGEFDELLRFDPLDAAEKMTGQSYKDDEFTLGVGMAMSMAHTETVRDELFLRNDTHLSGKFDYSVKIIEDLGFTEVYRTEFVGRYSGAEQYRIYWRDGALLTIESFTWSDDEEPSANSIKVYYNWRHTSSEDRWHFTASGCFHRESYDAGDHVWIGDHDGRQGLRHILAQLEQNGELLSEWIERPFLWFLTYADSDVKDYDYKKITEDRIAALPEHVRAAITPGEK